MRRILTTAAVLLVVVGGVVVLSASGSSTPQPSYWIQLDNAFGLIKGADFKVAGVKAGKISKLKVDLKTHKALIGVTVSQPGIPPFRTDASCLTRPQSLIGEYFVDCKPGVAPRKLGAGGVVPVTQTQSTIPVDTLNNVLRLPYRERLRILITELGVGVAGRGQDLNAALRRAVPALQQTDQVLGLLASQRTVIRNLTHDANVDLTTLARNKGQVARFVVTARRTAEASAMRRVDLAGTFHRLPGFLEQLKPTMADLGATADAQTPTLNNLRASAGELTRFFGDLKPFSDASRPAFRSLGQTSITGRQSVAAATPTVALLRGFARSTPEVAKNLRILLRDLDDRGRAVERDPRSPGGRGYTGLEALLQYPFDQSLAINPFDQNSYMLRVALLVKSQCAPYRDATSLKKDPSLQTNCASVLGSHQPGINEPDPSTQVATASASRANGSRSAAGAGKSKRAAAAAPVSKAPPPPAPSALQGRLKGLLGAPSTPAAPGGAPQRSAGDGSAPLLNYLLSP